MPAYHRLGSLDLALLSDGTYYQDAGAVFGVVPRVMWERLGIELTDRYQMPLALNSLLVRSQGKTILVETGVGDKERVRAQSSPVSEGTLLDELRAAGVAPDDVDVVINTHLHADHCGWNTTHGEDGEWKPTFPRARYLIQRGEWGAAVHPNERTRATYLPENMLPLESAGQLDLVEGETRVTDDVTIITTPGHTHDHASIILASSGERAIYIGDMIQHPVQLERTAWVSSFDILPLVSMETKKAVVQRAIDERQLVISVHCPFPGLGRMSEGDDGKRHWSPVEANDGHAS